MPRRDPAARHGGRTASSDVRWSVRWANQAELINLRPLSEVAKPNGLGNTEYSSSFGANQTRTKTPTDNKNRLSRSSETENGFGAKTATETETENCDGHATYVRRRPPGGLLGTCEGRGGLKLISTSCRSHAPRRFQSDHAHGFRNHGVHG